MLTFHCETCEADNLIERLRIIQDATVTFGSIQWDGVWQVGPLHHDNVNLLDNIEFYCTICDEEVAEPDLPNSFWGF